MDSSGFCTFIPGLRSKMLATLPFQNKINKNSKDHCLDAAKVHQNYMRLLLYQRRLPTIRGPDCSSAAVKKLRSLWTPSPLLFLGSLLHDEVGLGRIGSVRSVKATQQLR